MEKRGVPASKPKKTDDDDDDSRTKTPRRTSQRRTTCVGVFVRVEMKRYFQNPILCNGSVCLGFHYSAKSSIPFNKGCVYLSFSFSFSLVVLALVRDHLSFPSSLDTKPFVGVVGVVTVVVVVVITR